MIVLILIWSAAFWASMAHDDFMLRSKILTEIMCELQANKGWAAYMKGYEEQVLKRRKPLHKRIIKSSLIATAALIIFAVVLNLVMSF